MKSSQPLYGECRSSLVRTSSTVSVLFLMTIFLIVSHSSTEASQASVYLDNNSGYRGVIVSLSPEIQSSQRETVLLRLQDLFRRASDLLFKATRGKAFFKQVNFLIPKDWSISNLNSIKSIKKTHSRTVKDADFIVKSREEAFSYNPLAIQAGGCGKQGIQIQLSEKFMTDATSDAVALSNEGARLLLNQWAKYRYGVFDEKGFKNDPMYPLFWMTPGDGPGTEKITSCAATLNGQTVDTIRTLNKTTTGEICSLQINHETGHPVDSKCIPHADVRSNDDIISSLLSHPSLPKNEYFCDEKTHNKKSPNKHNNLCDGSSVWEVMNRHEDFKNNRDMNQVLISEERIVDFEFYQESDPRLAFIVDTEDSLKDNIFRSLIRFSSGLPPSSQLLMLDMKDERSIHEQDRPDWTAQKDGLSSIWGRDWSSKGKKLCLKCVVEEFLIKLRKVEGESADLIIVTPGVIQDSEQDVTTISESLITKGVSLRVVVYPYSRRKAPHLEPLRELVSKVRGSIHLVTDSIHSPVSAKLLLFDVFDSFLTNNPNIRIARQTFQVPGEVDFKFSVDQSLLSKDIQLITFFSSKTGDIDSLQNYYLKSNIEKFNTKSLEYKTSNHNFQVPLESRQAGDWTLHYSSGRNDTLTGVAYAAMSGHRTPITVKCYMTDYMANVSIPGDGSPPTLFVSVSQDLNQLVQNARVEVTLTDDVGNVIPSASNLLMIDDGLGTPDITKGDGIYSLYLTQLSEPGFYGVHVTVRSDEFKTKLQQSLSLDDDADCCGSVVPERRHGNLLIHHLERYHDCGQIYLREKYNQQNYVGKMKDVKVESVDTSDRKLSLVFSPPPGNFEHFELRMFSEDIYHEIRNNFERGTYITQYPYERYPSHEKIRLVVPIKSSSAGTYYFAFKVTGTATSTISNIMAVHMGPDRSQMISTDGSDSSYVTSQDTGNLRGLEPWQIVAISGGAIILFILLCFCICCLCLNRGNKDKKSDDEEAAAAASKAGGFGKGGPHNPHPSSLTIQTTMGSAVNLSTEKINHSMMNHGLSTISHDQIHPHQNSELQATISPVQSWDAGVILDHYQKVQQAKERKETPPIMKMEEVLLPRDGSCSSSSDNPSRESGSYDDNAFGMVHQGWRPQQPMAYDNHGQYIGHDGQFMGLPHQQVMMSQGYPSMYTDQYYVDPQPPIHWQEAYTTRSQTPSDVTDSYDPRYAHPSNRRSTAAVSQV